MFLEQVFTYRHKWYHYLIMIFIVVPIFMFLFKCLVGLLALAQTNRNIYVEFLADPTSVSACLAVIFLCLSHVGVFFAFLLFFKKIHKQSVLCLFSAYKKVRWKRIFVGMGISMMVYAVFQGVPILLQPSDSVEFVFKATDFIPYLLILIPMLLIQVTAEELFFRSYIMQATAIFARFVIVPVIVAALIFMVHHPQQSGFDLYWVQLIALFVSGLMYSAIVVLDDGIELNIGNHFISNLIYFTLWNHGNNPSLFQSHRESYSGAWFIALEVFISLIFLFIFTKIYHWDWRRLLQKIEKPAVEGADSK